MSNRKRFWWVLVILWCGMIFLATASPAFTGANTEKLIEQTLPKEYTQILASKTSRPMSLNLLIRKSAHFIIFGLLAVVVWKALGSLKLSFVIAWGFATLYGATDEIHQSFVPDRSAKGMDVVIDSLGAFTALMFVYTFIKFREKRTQ